LSASDVLRETSPWHLHPGRRPDFYGDAIVRDFHPASPANAALTFQKLNVIVASIHAEVNLCPYGDPAKTVPNIRGHDAGMLRSGEMLINIGFLFLETTSARRKIHIFVPKLYEKRAKTYEKRAKSCCFALFSYEITLISYCFGLFSYVFALISYDFGLFSVSFALFSYSFDPKIKRL
jgi:hypothetical protein